MGAWCASHLNINCNSCCIWSRQNFFTQIPFWEAKCHFFLNRLWSWAWLHNVHSSQVSSMLYLPKRDLDHVQILFWISSNSPTNFQCLWSYNVFSATDQCCKHLKGKGKILAAPRSFFSKLRDGSIRICVIQPLNILKPCTRHCSSYSMKRTLWKMIIKIYFWSFILNLWSKCTHRSMFCCNQSVRICTEPKILYALEVCHLLSEPTDEEKWNTGLVFMSYW